MLAASAATAIAVALAAPAPARHDLVLRGGTIYDGSGDKPYVGDVAIDGDRITYVGPPRTLAGRTVLDVHGQAMAPGFINMLAHPEESFLIDGRALSDLTQGVTLEVLGEDSMGPLTPHDEGADGAAPGRHQISGDLDDAWASTWRVSNAAASAPNVASFVGARTVRTYVLGEADVQPTRRSSSNARAGAPGRWRRARWV